MTSTTEVAVWEWEVSNSWHPYEPNVSNGIEEAFQPYFKRSQSGKSTSFIKTLQAKFSSQDVVSLKQYKPSLSSYEVDFNSMLQKNTTSGFHRAVRRQTYPLDSLVQRGIVWGYHSGMEQVTYCNDIGSKLEQASLGKNNMVHLGMTSFNTPFTVYLDKMIQTHNFSGEEYPIHRTVMVDRYTTVKVPSDTYKAPPNHRSKPPSSSPFPKSKPVTRASSSGGQTSLSLPTPGRAHRTVSHSTSPSVKHGSNASINTFSFGSSCSNQHSTSNAAYGNFTGIANLNQSNSPLLRAAKLSLPSTTAERLGKQMHNGRTSFDQGIGSTMNGSVYTDDDALNSSRRHSSAIDVVRQFGVAASSSEGECPICCDLLTSASCFGSEEGASGWNRQQHSVMQLKKCKHTFHTDCIVAMYNNSPKNGCVQCPTCKMIYGKKIGTCPRGRMDYTSQSAALPGHPGHGTIEITYTIQPGLQGPEHPNPGKSYRTQGFPRKGLLPNSCEGRKVLKLLIEAFQRRLTFTIGTSVTTGVCDAVVWNEIHHKSTRDNSSGHGYPDEKYLENVTAELAAQGVTLDDEYNS